jgi:hypothetical protein
MSEQPPSERIDDPEDYGASERLKQIYQARRELRDIRREAAAYRRSAPKESVAYYRTGVESYLMELEPLFYQNETGVEIWQDRFFGTVTIEPPETAEQPYYQIGGPELEPAQYRINGLNTLFQIDEITHIFEIEEESELSGRTAETTKRRSPIPWDVLNRMVSVANRYCSELGIGLDVSANNDPWRFVEFDDGSSSIRGLDNGN